MQLSKRLNALLKGIVSIISGTFDVTYSFQLKYNIYGNRRNNW